MSKPIKSACLAFLLVFFVSFVGKAQSSTATLSGTVVDANGAIVPGASVTLSNTATGFERKIVTDDEGSFFIPLLQPANYTLTVARDGFASAQVENVILNVGDQKALRVELKVSPIKDEVIITPDASLVETGGSVGTTVDQTFVRNLPLNGRSFQSLILLTPGVVATETGTGSRFGQFSVNGQRGNANNFTVDGVSANTGVMNSNDPSFGVAHAMGGSTPGLTASGGTNGLVSVDALEEFKIQTSTYSAEFGRQPGGQVSLVTRSGKNQFQGTVFEYVRNDVFDANDWFANAAGRKRSPLRQNMFGGTFSGPVFFPRFGEGGSGWYNGRNRTFFFFSYEGLRLLLPQTTRSTVHSLRLREAAAPTVRPLLNSFPVPTEPEILTNTPCPVPPAPPNPACDPVSGRLFSGFSPFTAAYSDPSSLDAYSIRIDHAINDKVTLFGRYNSAPSSSSTRNFSQLSRVTEAQIKTRSLTLGSTMLLTPRLSNEVRFNLGRGGRIATDRLDDLGGAVPVDPATLILDPALRGNNARVQVGLSFSGQAAVFISSGVSNNSQRQFNLVDNVSWEKGNHQLKFGIDFRRLTPIFEPIGYSTIIGFANETQIRSGFPQAANISSQVGSRPIYSNFSLYGQDRWKLTPRLTLDLGLRWEINPAPGEADGKKPVIVIGADDVRTATLAPPNTPIYKTDYRAFAPRLGFAYQLSDTQGWERVVRGGFGVYYDLGSSVAAIGFTQFPFVLSRSAGPAGTVPFPIPPAQAAPPVSPGLTLPITGNVIAPDPNLKLPYTLQWNFSIEQSLGAHQTVSASYVGAAGRRLLTLRSINNPVAGQRPNQNFGRILVASSNATSDYNSLQLQYQRRLTRGLQALVNYTWSHAIDEVSDEVSSSVLERGNADFDVRHNLSSALTYNLPGQWAKGVLGPIFRNWSIDGIVHAQSATPVNLDGGTFVDEDGREFRVRPDLVSGQPLYLDDPGVPGGRRFNIAAFVAPPRAPNNGPFLRQGTLGRNVLRGLPLYQLDLSLRRQFNLTEKLNIQVRAEAFNVFNHPNFGLFSNTILVPSQLGVPTRMLGRQLAGLSPLYQLGGPRSLQFSLRVSF